MKRSHELYLFIGFNVTLVLLSIYKESRFIALFYEQQRLEKKLAQLKEEERALKHAFEDLKNYKKIQATAKERGLAPVALSRVRHVNALKPT